MFLVHFMVLYAISFSLIQKSTGRTLQNDSNVFNVSLSIFQTKTTLTCYASNLIFSVCEASRINFAGSKEKRHHS